MCLPCWSRTSARLLLLSDLGQQNYVERIRAGIGDRELQTLYREALAALVKMQQAPVTGLAPYDTARLAQELTLFPEWYVSRHHGVTLDDKMSSALEKIFALLSASNGGQPTVLVHRDYHSPNLMVCDQPQYGPNPGIIDFQDALAGPITYDLASLVTDARTTWKSPSSWTGRSATGKWRAPPACRWMPTSPNSTAPMNGWACSATCASWACSHA